MKKLLLLALCIMNCALCINAQAQKAVIKGHMQGYDPQDKVLAMFGQEGRDTVKFDAQGNFVYERDMKEPGSGFFYCLTNGRGNSGFQFYMENGKTSIVEMVPDPNEKRYNSYQGEFSGDNKDVNEYFHWRATKMNAPGKENLATFKAYMAYMDKFNAEDAEMLKKITNKTFVAQMQAENAKEKAQDMDAMYYPNMYRNEFQKNPDDPEFIAYLKSKDFNDVNNIQVLSMYLNMTNANANEDDDDMDNPTLKTFKRVKELSTNQDVINGIADQSMQTYMVYSGGGDGLRKVYEAYKQTSTNKEAIQKIADKVEPLLKLAKGSPATDFTMKDRDGKEHHFLDVIGHGKKVYVDFWATWCGPCCKEIPFVEKAVEKYKDRKDIKFVSVSLDDNQGKWLKKLDADKPTWEQYIIPENFNSEFAKQYNIQAIPRFMMFDEKGNIITISAPRPSAGADFDKLFE